MPHWHDLPALWSENILEGVYHRKHPALRQAVDVSLALKRVEDLWVVTLNGHACLSLTSGYCPFDRAGDIGQEPVEHAGLFKGQLRFFRGDDPAVLPHLDDEASPDALVGPHFCRTQDGRADLLQVNTAVGRHSVKATSDLIAALAENSQTLVDLRAKVEKHIKNTYLKRVDAPVGVKPALKCWMELNEG